MVVHWVDYSVARKAALMEITLVADLVVVLVAGMVA